MTGLSTLLAASVAVAVPVIATMAEPGGGSPDEPVPRRRHRGRSSGTILVVATVAGVLAASWPTAGVARLLAGGGAMWAVGVLADRRLLRPGARIALEAAAGGLGVLLLGLGTDVTANAVSNALVVMSFVVVVTESVRLLDAAPRAAPGVVAPLAVTVALASGLGGGRPPATLAAALAGAAAGMLVAGRRGPFWLGESGSLFAGFLLAGLLIDLRPATPRPLSLAVVLPLLAVPVTNAAVVALGRLRRRLPITQRRPDGLAHRLRSRRVPWWAAVSVLCGLQSVVGAAALLADRGRVPVAVPAAAALASVVILLIPARSPRGVHPHPPTGWSPATRAVLLATTAVAVLAVVPSALAMAEARRDVSAGLASAQRGLAALRLGQLETARQELAGAEGSLSAAESSLANPLTSLGLGVPVLGPHLAAGRLFTSAAAELAASGSLVAGGLPPRLLVREAVVPVDQIRALRPQLERAAGALEAAEGTMGRAELAYLMPPLQRQGRELREEIARSAADAALAVEASEVLPALFGADAERHYFVALQNPAEQRGSGGIVGSFAELTATAGRLQLTRTGRAADLNFFAGGPPPLDVEGLPAYLHHYAGSDRPFVWQDITLSPDFPSVATAIEELYPRYGGRPVDGVVSVDSIALGALLSLTGPVRVPEWPEFIDASNAADILLRQQYLRLAGEEFSNLERVDFLDSLMKAVFQRIETGVLPPPAQIARVLGPMVREGRIQLHSREPGEQAFLERLGASGALPPVEGTDSLTLVNNNSGGNKLDIFLERSLSYSVSFDPASGRVEATAEVALHNRAPVEGLPDYVVGSSGPVETPPGTNRLYLSLYTPLDFDGASLDHSPLAMSTTSENERNVHSAYVTIPPGGRSLVSVMLSGWLPPGAAYSLALGHQPTIVPDQVDLQIRSRPGWEATRVEGDDVDGEPVVVSTRAATPRRFSVVFSSR